MNAQIAASKARLRNAKESIPINSTTHKELQSIWSKNTPSKARKLFLASQAPAIASFSPEGQIQVFTHPKISLNPTKCFASLGPSLTHCNPISFSTSSLGQLILTVAPKSLADKVNAPILSQEQHSPSNTNAPNSKDPPKDIGTDKPNAVFCSLPTLIPVYTDDHMPLDLDLSKDLPDNINTLPAPTAIFILGMKWLYTTTTSKAPTPFPRNSMKSLSTPSQTKTSSSANLHGKPSPLPPPTAKTESPTSPTSKKKLTTWPKSLWTQPPFLKAPPPTQPHQHQSHHQRYHHHFPHQRQKLPRRLLKPQIRTQSVLRILLPNPLWQNHTSHLH